MLSRNSQSSRALPTRKLIDQVADRPYIPYVWGENQRGMVAGSEITISRKVEAEAAWLRLRDAAMECADTLDALGVHKQHVNRTLELFSEIHTIATATDDEWLPFFKLRTAPDVYPEFRELADKMLSLWTNHSPALVPTGAWHAPFVTGFEQKVVRVSAARCARVSYLTHEGNRDILKDLELANELERNMHMTPFEHQARPMLDHRKYANFTGWKSQRYDLERNRS